MGYILGEPTVQQYFDANGDPLENGTIEFFIYNTSTPTPIYSNSTGTSAGTSVTLNSIGAPENGGTSIALFFDESVVYKIVRKDSAGSAIAPTIGPYYPNGGSAITIDAVASTATDSLYDYTGASNGDQASVAGYYVPGDGGGGMFYWNSTSTAADDGGITILPTGHVGNGRWKRIAGDWISVKAFGPTGDGVTDDTTELQAAADYAASTGIGLTGHQGDTYLFSTLLIKNGVSEIDLSMSTLLPDGTTVPANITTEAAVVLQGALTGGTAVDSAKISLTIDMQNGDRTAILGDGCTTCQFIKNTIYGFTNSATDNHRGIRLQEGASYNLISENYITGFDAPTQRGLMIELWASLTGLTDFGGFFSGTISRQPTPAMGNIISNNVIKQGSYSVNLQGAEKTVVDGNVFYKNNHRSVILQNSSWNNIISNNQCLEFTSSGILCGYGSSNNLVTGNLLKNEGALGAGSGQGAIICNTGGANNLITGNYIDAGVLYSVYIGPDSSFNVVKGNHCKNFYSAGVQVDSDWIAARPTYSLFSLPSYVTPDSIFPGATSWTYNDLEGTVIQDNVFYHGYTGRSTAAISLAQIQNTLVGATTTVMKNTTIKGNSVTSMDQITYGLFIYQDVASSQQEVRVSGNTWNPDAVFGSFLAADTTGVTANFKDNGVVLSEANGLLDEKIHGEVVTFTDGDTTPSIGGHYRYFRAINSASTSITDFDDPVEGQEILFRLDNQTTIVYSSLIIRPKGLVNVVGPDSNSFISFKSIAGIWYELWRSF